MGVWHQVKGLHRVITETPWIDAKYRLPVESVREGRVGSVSGRDHASEQFESLRQ